jgi:hypothetical protein
MRRILEDVGYHAIACCSTVDDFERVVDDSDPVAVVYEVGLPSASELKRFHDIRRRPAFAHRPMMVDANLDRLSNASPD